MNSTWLITSELANQRARKVLFTCVVYTNAYFFAFEKSFFKVLNKIFHIVSNDIIGLEISHCLSANHNPDVRCVICAGVALFAPVLHLNCTALSQSEFSTFSCILLLFLILQYLCSFRRKRRNLANQLRGNLQADQRENQQRVNNRDGIDGGYEVVPVAEQRVNNRDGIDGGDEVVPQAEQRDNDRDGIDGGDEVVPVAEQRDNDRDGNDGGYEVVPVAEQRVNDRDGNDGGDEVVPQAEQRSNDRDGNDGTYVFDPQAEQRGNRLRGNNGEGNNDRDRIVFNKYFNISQVSFHGANQDIVDNRRREHLDEQRSAAGNKDMSFHQGLGNLNIPGNQHRENCNEQGCEVTYENEVAHENDNQQLDEAYEDMNASRALATSQERSESATARHPTENDDDVSGTYTNPVQCTDDITKNF